MYDARNFFYHITLTFHKLWKVKLCDQALKKNRRPDLTVVNHWGIVVVRMYGT
jgi:phage terminase large subunit-like protein